jgi:polyhydroxyalkanoate synthesis repressor PhaR
MTVIKRYSNRKLYDTERSCYITLDEIAEMVRDGEDVKIVDNRTGEDLTTVTLAQILYEEERRDKRGLNVSTLRLFIQSPAEILQRLSRPMTELREQTQQQVDTLRRRAQAQQEELVTPVRDFVENVQRTVDEMQTRFDSRVRDLVSSVTHMNALEQEVADLRKRVATLEDEIARMQQAARPSRPSPTRRTPPR